jgi:hypothetical protein
MSRLIAAVVVYGFPEPRWAWTFRDSPHSQTSASGIPQKMQKYELDYALLGGEQVT